MPGGDDASLIPDDAKGVGRFLVLPLPKPDRLGEARAPGRRVVGGEKRAPGAVSFARGFLFTFRAQLIGETIREELHRFVITREGRVVRPPRWEELVALPWREECEGPPLERRRAVEAAYRISEGELVQRVLVSGSDLSERAVVRQQEEEECLRRYYDALCHERLRPIRRVLHQLAVSQTYLGLTKRRATAARYASETLALQEQVQGFLATSRRSFETLAAERDRRLSELAGRYEVNARCELVAVAELFRPDCPGCKRPGCRTCPELAAVRLPP